MNFKFVVKNVKSVPFALLGYVRILIAVHFLESNSPWCESLRTMGRTKLAPTYA